MPINREAMEFLLYQIKVALLFLLMSACFRLLLARETLHALNRAVVLLSMLLSAVIPLCVITVHVSAPLQAVQFPQAVFAAQEAASSGFDWSALLLALYLVGVAAVLVSLAFSVFSLLRLISRGERLRQPDGTVLVISDRDVAPMSWFNYIILSRDDFDSGCESIMIHEKAHVRRRHSLDVLFSDLFTAMQWFNPAAWVMRGELRAIHEYEADEQVLKSGVDAKEYQLLLVRKATGLGGPSVSNKLNHGQLKNRINMMLTEKSSLMSACKALFLVPLVCAGLAANARSVQQDVPEVAASFVLNGTVSIDSPDSLLNGVKVYVDKKLVPKENLNSIDPKEISSMEVFKTEDGNSIEITTMKNAGSGKGIDIRVVGDKNENAERFDGRVELNGRPGKVNTKGLEGDVYVDGVKVDKAALKNMSPDEIESITVLKGENPSIQVITRK